MCTGVHVVEIVLPYSEDGFYRFGDLAWLISQSLCPDDEGARNWIKCVYSWRESGADDGIFERRLAPDGCLTDKVEDTSGWSTEPLLPSNAPESLLVRLSRWRLLALSLGKGGIRFPDGGLVIHTDYSPGECLLEANRMAHMASYREALEAAAYAGGLVVCDSSGLPLRFLKGQALQDGAVHIDSLNEWGRAMPGGQCFRQTPRMLRFEMPATPLCIPAELLHLPPKELVCRWYSMAGYRGEGNMRASELALDFAETLARQSKGYFYPAEVAQSLANQGVGHAEKLLQQIEDAVRLEKLRCLDPETRVARTCPGGVSIGFDVLLKLTDVNAWLADAGADYLMQHAGYVDADTGPRSIAGRKLWRLNEAIRFMASMPGAGVSAEGLKERLSSHDESSLLTVRDVASGKPRRATNLCVFLDEWLFAEDFNAWLEVAGFLEPYRLPVVELDEPGPDQQITTPPSEQDKDATNDGQKAKAVTTTNPSIDFDQLATRRQLIQAFGQFTGMNMSWFNNLKDTPKLSAARKAAGKGGRNSAEPLFCPFEVMLWLVDQKRRRGRQIQNETGWRMLKQHFPGVYELYKVGSPLED